MCVRQKSAFILIKKDLLPVMEEPRGFSSRTFMYRNVKLWQSLSDRRTCGSAFIGRETGFLLVTDVSMAEFFSSLGFGDACFDKLSVSDGRLAWPPNRSRIHTSFSANVCAMVHSRVLLKWDLCF